MRSVYSVLLFVLLASPAHAAVIKVMVFDGTGTYDCLDDDPCDYDDLKFTTGYTENGMTISTFGSFFDGRDIVVDGRVELYEYDSPGLLFFDYGGNTFDLLSIDVFPIESSLDPFWPLEIGGMLAGGDGPHVLFSGTAWQNIRGFGINFPLDVDTKAAAFDNIVIRTAPEPASIALTALGIAAVAIRRRRCANRRTKTRTAHTIFGALEDPQVAHSMDAVRR
jgi:hypothetical protein